jgi:hypothetical protein
MMTLRFRAIIESPAPGKDTRADERSRTAAQRSTSLPAPGIVELRREGLPARASGADRRRPASRASAVKTLLFAFGPLLLLAALGLVGSRISSLETRNTATSGEARAHPSLVR